jgi:hypothetical protein
MKVTLDRIIPAKDNKHKFVAVFILESGKPKSVRFGTHGSNTYIDDADEVTRKNYRARHANDVKNNNDPMSRGNLSWYLNWGDSHSLSENLASYKKKFNV